MLKMIVVGTDNSKRARTAVDYAAELARSSGAKLRIVTVHRSLPSAHSLAHNALGDLSSEVGDTLALGAHRACLQPLAQRLRERGLDVQLHVVAGDPASAIVSCADELQADLVVIGNRGLRGFRGLFGSIASAVVRNATVPVLVVPTG